MKSLTKKIVLGVTIAMFLVACGGGESNSNTTKSNDNSKQIIDPMNDKGIGPIISVDISGVIDVNMAIKGEEIFKGKCAACHKMDKRKIGPEMAGITAKRTPEWIMNMIMNPDQMVKENAQARELLMEYSAPMANQSLTESETRAILEYFRQYDNENLLTQK